MSATVLSADKLFALLGQSSLSVQSVVKHLLQFAPLNSVGQLVPWPNASTLTVEDLLNTHISYTAIEPKGRRISGADATVLYFAEVLNSIALYENINGGEGLEMAKPQFKELHKVAMQYLTPHAEDTVLTLLKAFPDASGFYQGFISSDPDELEALISSSVGESQPKYQPVRIHDEPFEGSYQLRIWRTTRPAYALAREKLFDIQAMFSDHRGATAAYLSMRVAFLPKALDSATLVAVLDNYDAQGLELGVCLQTWLQSNQLEDLSLFGGGGLVHLQNIEVRSELRGRGLGARFLKAVLPLATAGISRRPLARLLMSVRPLQFSFPLTGLTPDLHLESLDARDSLHAYFEKERFQDVIPSMKGTEVIYLPNDKVSYGSQLEQFQALSDAFSTTGT